MDIDIGYIIIYIYIVIYVCIYSKYSDGLTLRMRSGFQNQNIDCTHSNWMVYILSVTLRMEATKTQFWYVLVVATF